MSDRVSERRRAAQLARHYRDQENLTIAEIARRLGRAEATIKAYLYDPSKVVKKRDSSPFGGESGRVTRPSSQRRRPSLSSAGGTPELHARPGHDVHAARLCS